MYSGSTLVGNIGEQKGCKEKEAVFRGSRHALPEINQCPYRLIIYGPTNAPNSKNPFGEFSYADLCLVLTWLEDMA